MPQFTVAGHPLHPMLIVAPAALIPFGFILDAMYRSTGKQSYADAAYYSMMGGVVGGLAAGAVGAMDYLEVQPQTEVKRTANLHAALNLSVLAATAVNLVRRRRDPARGSLALSALSALGIVVSGWFGGRMVYEQGMRVRGVSPIEHAPQMKLPFDDTVERAMLAEEKMIPAGGPALH